MKKLKALPLTTHWKIQLILFGVGLFIGLVCSQFSQYALGVVGMILGFGLILLSFAWQLVFVKCPRCGHGFHLRRPLSKHCPECGEKIL